MRYTIDKPGAHGHRPVYVEFGTDGVMRKRKVGSINLRLLPTVGEHREYLETVFGKGRAMKSHEHQLPIPKTQEIQ